MKSERMTHLAPVEAAVPKPRARKSQSVLIFDLEVAHTAEEVGGFEHISKRGFSVAVALEWPSQIVHVFTPSRIKELEKLLARAGWIIGYNILNFDLVVLQGAGCVIPKGLRCFDMMQEIMETTGLRCSLDSLVEANFAMKRSSHGLECIRFAKEGRWAELTEHCVNDALDMQRVFATALTRELRVPLSGLSKKTTKLDWRKKLAGFRKIAGPGS